MLPWRALQTPFYKYWDSDKIFEFDYTKHKHSYNLEINNENKWKLRYLLINI